MGAPSGMPVETVRVVIVCSSLDAANLAAVDLSGDVKLSRASLACERAIIVRDDTTTLDIHVVSDAARWASSQLAFSDCFVIWFLEPNNAALIDAELRHVRAQCGAVQQVIGELSSVSIILAARLRNADTDASERMRACIHGLAFELNIPAIILGPVSSLVRAITTGVEALHEARPKQHGRQASTGAKAAESIQRVRTTMASICAQFSSCFRAFLVCCTCTCCVRMGARPSCDDDAGIRDYIGVEGEGRAANCRSWDADRHGFTPSLLTVIGPGEGVYRPPASPGLGAPGGLVRAGVREELGRKKGAWSPRWDAGE